MFRPACALLLLATTVTPAYSQAPTGRLSGSVTDPNGGVVPGVLISADADGRIVNTSTTSNDGTYRLELPPGDYTIRAELEGFRRFEQPNIEIRVGSERPLNIGLTVGDIHETISVVQETPLLDTGSGGHSVNVSGELLRSMPLTERREWFGALLLAPGVTSADWSNNQKFISVHGADATANIVQIDGADMTATTASFLSYVGLNLDAIDDVHIKTAGVDASSPLGLGGVINIATATGSNQFRGTGTLFVQPRAWNDSNAAPGGTSSTVDQLQLDGSAGAPIRRDHVWAFAAYRYADVNSGVSRTSRQLDTLRALIPGYQPFDNTSRAHLWFTKLTAQLSAQHQLTGFYQRDVSPAAFAEAVTERPRTEATGGTGAAARLSSVWSDRLTTRLGASYNDKRRDVRETVSDQPLQRVYQSTLVSSGRLVGNGRLVDRGSPLTGGSTQPNSKLTVTADATYFGSGFLGSHEIQSGVYLQPRLRVGQQDFYPNGGFVFEEAVLRDAANYDAGVVPFHRVRLDDTTLTRLRRRGSDYAIYVQDAWRPWPRLTINAGLRVDWIAWHDERFDVTSQRSTEFGPRLGINYALTSTARDVLKARWVRVHDQAAATGVSIGTVALGQQDEYDLDLNGTFETTFVTPPTFAITPGRSIDPDLHQPYAQEWGVGYSKQLPGGVTMNLDLVRRDYRDRTTLVETNGRYDGTRFAGYVDESINELYQVTNNRWNWPAYTSMELSATKRTARFQGIASYARQWRHIEGTWQPNDPASFIQPSAFPNDRGIGSPSGSTSAPSDANSLSGTHMTQRLSGSAQWQDHVVRLGAAYTAPWSVLIGANYTFQSGSWSGPIIDRVAAPDPSFGPQTVTLSNGRVVQNPLATVFRFSFPTRGDGQLRTAALHVMNLRFGRRFALGKLTLDGSIDVFNVTNNGTDSGFESTANQTFSPLYGLTTFRQLPRSAQVVIRASF